MSVNPKVSEAREHCKAAERAVKTGVFRWKADYDSAADEYSQAGQCYRIARDLPNAKECFLKASDCYKRNNAFFHAAKCLESAMIACKEIAQPDEIYNLAVEAGSLYQQYGSGDAGASVLDKAAKILEERSPELSVKLFQQAADVSSGSSSSSYTPTNMQIDHLMRSSVTVPDNGQELTTEQNLEWDDLTEILNDLCGPTKTTEEWMQIMAAHKASESIVSSSEIVDISDDESDYGPTQQARASSSTEHEHSWIARPSSSNDNMQALRSWNSAADFNEWYLRQSRPSTRSGGCMHASKRAPNPTAQELDWTRRASNSPAQEFDWTRSPSTHTAQEWGWMRRPSKSPAQEFDSSGSNQRRNPTGRQDGIGSKRHADLMQAASFSTVAKRMCTKNEAGKTTRNYVHDQLKTLEREEYTDDDDDDEDSIY